MQVEGFNFQVKHFFKNLCIRSIVLVINKDGITIVYSLMLHQNLIDITIFFYIQLGVINSYVYNIQ